MIGPSASRIAASRRVTHALRLGIAQLPFPSLVVASRNDPYIFFERAHSIAKNWGSTFVDAGFSGHINADSDLGDWAFGQSLLDQLIDNAHEQASVMRQMRPAIPMAHKERKLAAMRMIG